MATATLKLKVTAGQAKAEVTRFNRRLGSLAKKAEKVKEVLRRSLAVDLGSAASGGGIASVSEGAEKAAKSSRKAEERMEKFAESVASAEGTLMRLEQELARVDARNLSVSVSADKSGDALFRIRAAAESAGQVPRVMRQIDEAAARAGASLANVALSTSRSSKAQQKQAAVTQRFSGSLKKVDRLMDQLGLTSSRTTVRINAAGKAMVSFSGSATTINRAAAAARLLRAEVSKLGIGLGTVSIGAAKSANKIKENDDKTRKLVGSYGQLRAAIAALGFGILVRRIGEATFAMERAQSTLLAVTGSSQGAAQQFRFAAQEAERLGLDLFATTVQFARISAASKATGLTGQQTKAIFSSIGEAAAVMRLSTADTLGVFKALEQILSKNTLSSEEVRHQMGDRMPAAMALLAKSIQKPNESMAEATKRMQELLEQGELLAVEVLPKFAAEIREAYGGALDVATRSLRANVTRLNNDIQVGFAAFGNAAAPEVNKLIQTLRGATQEIQALVPVVQTLLKTLNGALKLLKLLPISLQALGPLVSGLATALTALSVAAVAAAVSTEKLKLLLVGVSPAAAQLALALGAVVAIATVAQAINNSLTESFTEQEEIAKRLKKTQLELTATTVEGARAQLAAVEAKRADILASLEQVKFNRALLIAEQEAAKARRDAAGFDERGFTAEFREHQAEVLALQEQIDELDKVIRVSGGEFIGLAEKIDFAKAQLDALKKSAKGKQYEVLAATLKRLANEALSEAAAAVSKMNSAMKAAGSAIQTFNDRGLTESERRTLEWQRTLKSLEDSVGTVRVEIVEAENALGAYGSKLLSGEKTGKKYAKAQEEIAKLTARLEKLLKQEAAGQAALNEARQAGQAIQQAIEQDKQLAIASLDEQLQLIIDETEETQKGQRALARFQRQQQLETRVRQVSAEAIRIYGLESEEATEATEKFRVALQALFNSQDAAEGARDQAKDVEKEWKRAFREIQRVVERTLEDLFRGNFDVNPLRRLLEGVADIFTQTLAEGLSRSLAGLFESSFGGGGVLGFLAAPGSSSSAGGASPVDPSLGPKLGEAIGEAIDEELADEIARETQATLERKQRLKTELGAAIGITLGGFISQSLGNVSEEAQLGSSIGGAVGAAIGNSIAPGVGTAIGGALGSVLGGLVGDIFGGGSSSAFSIAFIGGSRESFASADNELGNTARTLADQLTDRYNAFLREVGGFLLSRGGQSVTFRVDEGGIQVLIDGIWQDFGKDTGAALNAALRDAIQDTAFIGIGVTENVRKAITRSVSGSLEGLLADIDIAREIDAVTRGAGGQALFELSKDFDNLIRAAIRLQIPIADLVEEFERQAANLRASITESLEGFIPGTSAVVRQFLDLKEQALNFNAELERQKELFSNVRDGADEVVGIMEDFEQVIHDHGDTFHGATEGLQDLSAGAGAAGNGVGDLGGTLSSFGDDIPPVIDDLRLFNRGIDENAESWRRLNESLPDPIELQRIQQAQQSLSDQLEADLIENLLKFTENEGLRKRLIEARTRLEIASLRAQIETLAALGHLSESVLNFLRSVVDEVVAGLESGEFEVEIPSIGHGGAAQQQRRERRAALRAQVEDMRLAAAGFGTFAQELRRFNRELQDQVEEMQHLGGLSDNFIEEFRQLRIEEFFRPFQDIVESAGLSDFEREAKRINDYYARLEEIAELEGVTAEQLQLLAAAREAELAVLREQIFASVQEYVDLANGVTETQQALREIEEQFDEARAAILAAGGDFFDLIELYEAQQAAIQALRDELEGELLAYLDVQRGIGPFGRQLLDLQEQFDEMRQSAIDLGVDLALVAQAEDAATRALGIEFLGSLEQLGVTVPGLAEHILQLQFAMARADAVALAAAGAFADLDFTLEELLALIDTAEEAALADLNRPDTTPTSTPTDDLSRLREEIERTIAAWEELQFGPITREARALRKTFDETVAKARELFGGRAIPRRFLRRIQAAYQIAVQDLLERALEPFESLGVGPLQAELNTLEETFRDLREAAAVAGLGQQDLARIEAAYQMAIADFWTRALEPLRDFQQELLGEDPTLSPFEQLMRAQSEFEALRQRALAGDLEALQELPEAGRALIDGARAYLGTGVGFNQIFQTVQQTIDELLAAGESLGGAGDPLLDVGQRQLEAQSSMLIELTRIRESGDALLVSAEARTPTIDRAEQIDFHVTVKRLFEDLLDENRALREEVAEGNSQLERMVNEIAAKAARDEQLMEQKLRLDQERNQSADRVARHQQFINAGSQTAGLPRHVRVI